MKCSQLVAFASSLVLANVGSALTPTDLAAGATITAVVPGPQSREEIATSSSGRQFQRIKVTIGEGGRALVNGDPDWYLNSPLHAIELHVENVRLGAAMTTISLQSRRAMLEVMVVAPPSVWSSLVEEVLFPGPATSDAVRTRLEWALGEIAKREFVGDLAAVKEEDRIPLVRLLQSASDSTPILTIEKYRGAAYLGVDIGTFGSILDDLMFGQNQRIAYLFNDKLLTLLKDLLPTIEGIQTVVGVRLSLGIPHKSFLDKCKAPEIDKLAAYVKTDKLRRFADAETTDQALLDASVVLLNGDRVAVVLAE